MVYHVVDILTTLVDTMMCKPLISGLLGINMIKRIFDIFDFMPAWIQISMIRLARYLILNGNEDIRKQLVDFKVIDIIMTTLLKTQENQNMMFCTCWSVIKAIQKSNDKNMASYAFNKYRSEIETPTLIKVVCPILKMIGQWIVNSPMKPHVWIGLIQLEEEKNSDYEQEFEIPNKIFHEERSPRKLLANNKEALDRLNLFNRNQKERICTSSETRRGRDRCISMEQQLRSTISPIKVQQSKDDNKKRKYSHTTKCEPCKQTLFASNQSIVSEIDEKDGRKVSGSTSEGTADPINLAGSHTKKKFSA